MAVSASERECDKEGKRAKARATCYQVSKWLGLTAVVARYLVGLLEARTPSFFDAHKPVSLTTIATPHLGVPRYSEY